MNQANQEILDTRANANQMKTTAVALYIDKDRAVWGHIGDSRLYHFYNGNLADYTEDHSEFSPCCSTIRTAAVLNVPACTVDDKLVFSCHL